jgi:hypothetical protein
MRELEQLQVRIGVEGRIPHAGDRWPIKPFAVNVRRLAISRQQAKSGGVTLGNILDRGS